MSSNTTCRLWYGANYCWAVHSSLLHHQNEGAWREAKCVVLSRVQSRVPSRNRNRRSQQKQKPTKCSTMIGSPPNAKITGASSSFSILTAYLPGIKSSRGGSSGIQGTYICDYCSPKGWLTYLCVDSRLLERSFCSAHHKRSASREGVCALIRFDEMRSGVLRSNHHDKRISVVRSWAYELLRLYGARTPDTEGASGSFATAEEPVKNAARFHILGC